MPRSYSHVKVIAHRGNSSQAPENTLAAFQQAIELGVDFIECDLQLSKDKVPVVMHDGTIHRILADCVVCDVEALTWKELKKTDCGSWFDEKYSNQRVLSLKEFLKMPKGRVGAMIEIKEETFKEYELARIVGDIVKTHPPKKSNHGPLLLGSLNPNILMCLEGYLPLQKLIAIVGSEEDLEKFRPIKADYYALHHSLGTKELIKELQEEGKEVWAWTVNDKDTAIELIHNGIQGLITDHPKKIKQMHVKPHPFEEQEYP